MKVWEREYNKMLFDRLNLSIPAKATILDVGCGKGGLGEEFHNRYVGIDIEASPEWVKISNDNMRFAKGSICNIPFRDNYFDYIFVKEVIHHISKNERNSAFKELIRVLKETGALIILESNRNNPISYFHMTLLKGHQHLSKKEFCRLIKLNTDISTVDTYLIHCMPIVNKKLRYLAYDFEKFFEKISLCKKFFSINAAIIKK